ncbi:hypothetical protein L9F63_011235, partial [Diploptera punctata]
MEEEEDELSKSQQQTRSVQQTTRIQQSFSSRTTTKSASSTKISCFSRTPSDSGDQCAIQDEKVTESQQGMSFTHYTKSAISKSQGRLTHMLAYDDTLNVPKESNEKKIASQSQEREQTSSRLMQASSSSFLSAAQENQRYASSSSQLLSSAGGEESVAISSSDYSSVSAQAQTSVISKSPMMYLSASHDENDSLTQRRTLSRSLSPMSSTSSDGAGLSPSRTLIAAKSVETSAVGREGRQWLTASSGTYRSETAKSMESLRSNSTASASSDTKVHHTHRQSFLTSSERDMRRVVASSVEARSLENLEKEIRLMGKRKAVSGEELIVGAEDNSMTTAERRRGLYAGVITQGERRTNVPSHLSLPPPGAYLSLATPGADRKLTILSPHSPHQPDLLQFSTLATLKTRRKKAIVLPKLILPRSESDVFLDQNRNRARVRSPVGKVS